MQVSKSDASLQKWASNDIIRQDIKVSLKEGAHGMFRWAVCQLDTLGLCRSRKQLRQALLDLPPTLDETYNRILLSIEKSDREYAIRILLWLACAKRPLVLAEVAEVAAYDLRRSLVIDRDDVLEDSRDILSICSSLVTISASKRFGAHHGEIAKDESKTSKVSLAHYSVKEYLLSERIRNSTAGMFSLDVATSDNTIAEICLHYLLQFDNPSILNKDTLNEFALAMYSAHYWKEHAQTSVEHDDTLIKLILTLFNHENVAYTTWMFLIHTSAADGWTGNADVTYFGVAYPLYAALGLNLAMVTEALLAKYSQDFTGSEMQRALYTAVQYADENVLRMLLIANSMHGSGSAVSGSPRHIGHQPKREEFQRGKRIDCALILACLEYRENIVKLLLEEGANINAICVIEDLPNTNATSALEVACEGGNKDAVKLLLDAGADVNTKSEVCGHVLQSAILYGEPEIARMLLQRGARVDAPGEKFGNALQAACSYYEYIPREQQPCHRTKYKMVRLLIDHGADVNASGGYFGTALQAACSKYDSGLRTRYVSDFPLGRLCPCCQCDTIKSLLSKGAGINAQGGHFGNALQSACWYNQKEVVELLLNEGININAQGGRFGTALIAATEGGWVDIVKLLLENGTDIHAKVDVNLEEPVDTPAKVDVKGTTMNALQVAILKGDDEIKQLLLDHGARVEEVQT